MRSTPPVRGSIMKPTFFVIQEDAGGRKRDTLIGKGGSDMGESAIRPPRTAARSLALAAVAVVATLSFGTLRAEGQTPAKRVGGPRLKTSLNAYSFNKALVDHLRSEERRVGK